MNSEKLLSAFGEIRDEWIAGAQFHARRRLRRISIVAAAALLCLALTVSALAAADVAPAYELLYELFPAIAQKLKPVQRSCVDDGIRLEVISAAVEGDTAHVYLGLTDLTGDRVDETCDLFDSYDIHLSADSQGSCTFVDYDAAAKTATFLVEASRMDGRPIQGSKLTFSMNRFLSGKREFAGALPLDPSSAEAQPATQMDVIGCGYGWLDDTYADFTLERYLVPGELLSPMEGVTITGMGWVDGYLHIQTRNAEIFETDAHGFVYLVDAGGEVIPSVYEADFWDAAASGSRYIEQVFEITPEALEGCQLMGEFCSAEMLIEGDWEITFPLT